MTIKSFVIGAAVGITAGMVLANIPAVKRVISEGKKKLKKMSIDCGE